MVLRDRVPLTVVELLAGLDLGGNGEAFALVFRGDAGIDGTAY